MQKPTFLRRALWPLMAALAVSFILNASYIGTNKLHELAVGVTLTSLATFVLVTVCARDLLQTWAAGLPMNLNASWRASLAAWPTAFAFFSLLQPISIDMGEHAALTVLISLGMGMSSMGLLVLLLLSLPWSLAIFMEWRLKRMADEALAATGRTAVPSTTQIA